MISKSRIEKSHQALDKLFAEIDRVEKLSISQRIDLTRRIQLDYIPQIIADEVGIPHKRVVTRPEEVIATVKITGTIGASSER